MRALLLIPILLAGCPYGHVIPKSPTRLAALNTPYDDFNAAPPPRLENFVWSSNSGSKGAHFDLYQASGTFHETGFHYTEPPREAWPTLLDGVNSLGNEFGPCYAVGGADTENRSTRPVPLIFASDRPGGAGKLDLYIFRDGSVQPLPGVNGPANDAYWTSFRGGPEYFASDRGGKGYDIYEIAGDKIRRVDALCSDADDTAPFVIDIYGWKRMLFASNRKGGRGGYDIWWARFTDGKWGKPINLRRFNTRHNEFRPAPAGAMLIFSSDRPGGEGGYDLFYARLPDLE